MAVAGLHNVSAFGPSFFGDSRPSTHASSSLFQMWRELENEHVINQSCKSRQPIRNNSDTECSSTPKSVTQGSENGDDMSQHSYESKYQGDNNIIISDDLGEIERERVRQIFREWMNSGSKGYSSYGFCLNNSSGQFLSENECERVRNNGGRRPIRRLCGRQTLLDLLVSAQSERKRELLDLAGQRPVSEFPHRNRIQALLRGRFLRNERLVVDERPSSRGATELSLLRQRHTVSDLREGFLSKLDNSASTSVKSDDGNIFELESICREGEVSEIHSSSDIESGADGDPVSHNVISDHDVSLSMYSEDFTIANESFFNDDDRANDLGTNINEDFDYSLDASAQVEEFRDSVGEIEDSVWQQHNTVEFSERSDDGREDIARSWQEDSAYRSFPEHFDNSIEEHGFDNNNVVERDQIHESHQDWPDHDSQEAIGSWLDLPSGRIDTIYRPNDDSAHSMELRELFTRRRVSSLLHSSFRESLNQVLQSHVERLGHASGNSELEDASYFPALIEQDQEQINDDRTFYLSDGNFERNPFAPSSNLFAASEPLWNEDFQGTNWSHHDSNMQLETESEVINELRIDMSRLQQRMNNIQSMIEACMEMQFELQRSVRQEVSASLNPSSFPTDEEDLSVDNALHDESLWDYVRNGICCLCRDSKIDSLLYRCGHICACSQCADSLVRCKGKCPMCHAPAVEAVQAHFIQ